MPARKPTALKVLAGNPGGRALPENEPQPPVPTRAPSAPRWLPPVARQEWRRVAKTLVDTGVMTVIDYTALESYCVAYAQFRQAVADIEMLGTTMTTEKGNLVQSPAVGIANRSMVEMRKWMTEFGMTPASRPKIEASRPSEDEDTFFD